jgi:hypothetical protein
MSAANLDLLLIHPPAYGEFSPPLGIATLAGYLKANGISVKSLDYNIDFFNSVPQGLRTAWKFSESLTAWNDPQIYSSGLKPHFKKFAQRVVRDLMVHNPKYVGISVLETGAQASFDLIDTIQEFLGNEVRIIVGGPQIGKEQAADYLLKRGVYAAFRGEAEVGLLKLLQMSKEGGEPRLREVSGVSFLEEGSIVETGPQALHGLDALPFPDFSDFDLDSYAFRERLLPITTSRGCIAKCTFCGETNYMDRFRQVSAKRIVAELRNGIQSYGASVFRLNDSLINGNPRVLESWIDELLSSDIKIVFGAAQARISDKMTPVLLEKLKQAGCYLIQYGVETGSDRLMKIMRKGITSRLARDVIHRTKQAGIAVQVNIIVGHFEETLRDFLRTLVLILRSRKDIDVVNLTLYCFDKYSFDSAHAKGIENRFSEYWKGAGWQHTYAMRKFKRRLVLGAMWVAGIREA